MVFQTKLNETEPNWKHFLIPTVAFFEAKLSLETIIIIMPSFENYALHVQ